MKILRYLKLQGSQKRRPLSTTLILDILKYYHQVVAQIFFSIKKKWTFLGEILDILISSSVVYALLLQSISITFSLWILTDSLN